MGKKVYASPVAEKITFSYKEQIATTGGTTCMQIWTGFSDGTNTGCKITGTIEDSGIS